jgi:hypothetical protein
VQFATLSVWCGISVTLPYDGLICSIIFQKRKRETSKDLEVHQTVNAIVEIVKENYLASVLFFMLIAW